MLYHLSYGARSAGTRTQDRCSSTFIRRVLLSSIAPVTAWVRAFSASTALIVQKWRQKVRNAFLCPLGHRAEKFLPSRDSNPGITNVVPRAFAIVLSCLSNLFSRFCCYSRVLSLHRAALPLYGVPAVHRPQRAVAALLSLALSLPSAPEQYTDIGSGAQQYYSAVCSISSTQCPA